MKPLSHITDGFTESVIREMTRICLKHGGVNLAQGFPDFAAPEEIKAVAMKAIEDDLNQYAVTFGEPHLRQAITDKFAEYNRVEYDPDTDVTVTCGATEAMIASLMAIINPGDEVVVFEPFYENYGPDSILSGARPRYVTLYAPDWNFDPDELAAAFNEKTKAIIINTPNNPTGKVFSREELNLIAELCRRWDVIAVTDEIYEHILYDGAEHVSIASLEGMKERTITINGISKTYSLTGWRIGWTIAQPEITARIRKVHDFLTVGAARPLQEGAAFALGLPESYYAELAAMYEERRNLLYDLLLKAKLKPSLPKGAYYIIAQADEVMAELDVGNDFELAGKLIELVGVASVPGSSFYSGGGKGSKEIRFCFCKKPETMAEVAERLGRLAQML